MTDISYKGVLVIPSYNEILALPHLLDELAVLLTSNEVIIVVDDSPKDISPKIEQLCRDSLAESKVDLIFIQNGNKKGRGAAIRIGMQYALHAYPDLTYMVECDADGSHTPKDILTILRSDSQSDLLVGSRYLTGSKIIGWPITRRLFSSILNRAIPILFRVPLNDITNGLRRYSKHALEVILNTPQLNQGFIYLTEQAILINRASLTISEVPITFINRTLGESTVTRIEITNSLSGIFRLLKNRNYGK